MMKTKNEKKIDKLRDEINDLFTLDALECLIPGAIEIVKERNKLVAKAVDKTESIDFSSPEFKDNILRMWNITYAVSMLRR